MAMIEFKDVKKVYKVGMTSTVALDNVSFSIDQKEFVSFVGHSGAGKSTILKLIYAEEKPTSGEIMFNGEDITFIKPKGMPLHRRRIGTVFQDFKLLQKKTVYENVAFALEVSGYPNKEIQKSVPLQQGRELSPRNFGRRKAACGHCPGACPPASPYYRR
jgi:cell division transport system ATP-binding protein